MLNRKVVGLHGLVYLDANFARRLYYDQGNIKKKRSYFLCCSYLNDYGLNAYKKKATNYVKENYKLQLYKQLLFIWGIYYIH